MWAVSKGATLVGYACTHRCREHRCLYDKKHLLECSLLSNKEEIQETIRHLEQEKIRSWSQNEQDRAVLVFTLLTLELQALEASRQITPTSVAPLKVEAKVKRPRGRPRKEVAPTTDQKNIETYLTVTAT